jgi:enterochelin esterase-like enzyme
MALPVMAQETAGTMQTAEFVSERLGEPIAYSLYLPAGYETSEENYPTLYLLHGRGDDMSAWAQIAETLDTLIADEQIPPVIAVMPDAPWSERASYYVDSHYTGVPHGMPVETAFIDDLIPHIDATYRTIADRTARIAGGYSMGGYGALRYVLAHPDVFSGAIVLSPAVYIPLPPVDSSTREFGAFGLGDQLFDEAIYTSLNYPALLETFDQAHLPISMFIAVGDDEWKNENPDDFLHDLDIEAHFVFNRVTRVQSITSEFRVYNGGHDWDVWRRGFIEGMLFLAPRLRTATG